LPKLKNMAKNEILVKNKPISLLILFKIVITQIMVVLTYHLLKFAK